MGTKLDSLKEQLEKLAYIGSTIALVQWDQQVNMPKGAVAYRSNQMAYLEGLHHQMHTGEEFSSALAGLANLETGEITDNSLNDSEKRMVYEVWRDWHFAKCLPGEFVEEFVKLQTQSYSAWEKAKRTINFSEFSPFLDKIIKMTKEKAALLNPNVPKYDALVDQFEPYMTTADLDNLFSDLKIKVLDLVNKIKAKNKIFFDHKALRWPIEAQDKVVRMVLNDLKYNLDCGRQDLSEHPFSTSFHPTDARITTHYKENDLMFGITGSIHEAGHSLYEQGLDVNWFGTPLGSASSYGIHESQSRFYETRIGQSKSFWEYYYPVLRSHFFEQLKDVSVKEFYESVNQVVPGPIRLEADEVTYNLHIIIRYEMEKLIMSSDISADKLPELWNKKYEEYLGVVPESESRGILQDVHWSEGYFGYFPSYVLGSIYASQIYEKMLSEMPNMENEIGKGEFSNIREWLKVNIHARGRGLKPMELIEKVTGKPLTVEPYINYLHRKYGEIYGV